MKMFEKWNPVIRWIMFIPVLFITYFLANFLTNWALLQYLGPLEDRGAIASFIASIQFNLINVAISIYVSCKCAPRFRIIIASIYTALSCLIGGSSLTLVLLGRSSVSLFEIISTSIMTIIACIIVIIIIVNQEKETDVTKELYL